MSMLKAVTDLGGQMIIVNPQDVPTWLESQGARFCKVTAWNDPGNSSGKKPVGLAWQDKPLSWAQVEPHVKAGGNVGLICGQHSNGIIMLDIDDNLPGFFSAFPEYSTYPIIERGNLGKGKFLVRLPDGQEWTGEKKFKKTALDKHPFLEVLVTGNQGVIPPSKHPEAGAPYVCINAGVTIPTIEPEKLAADIARWVDLQQPAPENEPAAPDRSIHDNGSGPDLREAVREYWTPLKVFEHFGLTSGGVKVEGKFTRIFGNGGLFVNNNGLGWALTSAGKGAGGDCFDAWHYCKTNGQQYSIPREQFRATLLEMATAAGITIPAVRKHTHVAKRPVSVETLEQTETESNQPQNNGALIAYCLGRGETGDSELFSTLFSNRVKYDWLEKQFYTWQGSHWAQAAPGEIVRMIQGLSLQYLGIGTELVKAGDEKAKPYLKRASQLLASARINNVLSLVQTDKDIALTGKEWDIDSMTLPVKNGLIDLKQGIFRETTTADYVRTFAPVDWKGINEPAPVWERTLLEIFSGDIDLVNFARRLVGYMVTGLTKEQIIAILYGTGSNGKSLFVDVLAAVLGENFVFPTQAEAIMEAKYSDGNTASPYVYSMRGKRLILASEGKEGQKLNTGLVKQLTGDRLITARPLFGNPVTFQQTHKIMLITNHLPSIPDSEDYAIWRRIMPLPFDVQFLENPTQPNERKINKDLPELLKKEYSGILAWCVRGALEWQAQGLAAPAKVINATEHYKEAEDPIAQFIDERAVLGPNCQATLQDLHEKYSLWCMNYDYTPITKKALSARLTRKFGKPDRKTAGMCFRGIGLNI